MKHTTICRKKRAKVGGGRGYLIHKILVWDLLQVMADGYINKYQRQIPDFVDSPRRKSGEPKRLRISIFFDYRFNMVNLRL